MDFEFSTTEKKFLGDLKAEVGKVAKEAREDHVSVAFSSCAEVGYQALLDDPTGSESSTSLSVAASEIVAAVMPSLALILEMGRRPARHALQLAGTAPCPAPLREKQAPLPVAWREGGSHHFNSGLETTGERLKSGEAYRLQGHKSGIISGADASAIIVVGRIGEEGALFVVDGTTPGTFWANPLGNPDLPGYNTIDLTMEDCLVPAEHVVCPLPATELLASLAAAENCALLGVALGVIKRALGGARRQARGQEWKGKPLVAQQEVSFLLAEMLTLYQTAQLLAYRSACSFDTDHQDRAQMVGTAKVFCTEAAERVASLALDVLALTGAQYLADAWRDFTAAKTLALLGTPNEIARNGIADEALERWG